MYPIMEHPKHIKQTLTKLRKEIKSNTLILKDFNSPLLTMDRSSRQENP
jgi:hypothetical protein